MQQAGFAWLAYALMTVFAWGTYGNLLHTGQLGMGDPVNGRYKAFLFVGIAYFLVAVLAPIAVLVAGNANWNLPMKGAGWSLIAGCAGAVGAFGILLAFGAKGNPGGRHVDRIRRRAHRERHRIDGPASAGGRHVEHSLAVCGGDSVRGDRRLHGDALQAAPGSRSTIQRRPSNDGGCWEYRGTREG